MTPPPPSSHLLCTGSCRSCSWCHTWPDPSPPPKLRTYFVDAPFCIYFIFNFVDIKSSRRLHSALIHDDDDDHERVLCLKSLKSSVVNARSLSVPDVLCSLCFGLLCVACFSRLRCRSSLSCVLVLLLGVSLISMARLICCCITVIFAQNAICRMSFADCAIICFCAQTQFRSEFLHSFDCRVDLRSIC